MKLGHRVYRVGLLVGLAGCWGKSPAPAPVAPKQDAPIVVKHEPTCTDASIGLDRGTRDLREPDTSVAQALRDQCNAQAWSPRAIACFTTMKAPDLAACVHELTDPQRVAVFEALAGTDQASIAIALVKLQTLQVGVPECDAFVGTVAVVLGCEAMPLAQRATLGSETADFWSLPSSNLRADLQQRMATVCKRSLDDLIVQAKALGCL
ncbi:MAG: hypothetical protein NT062_35640 [Proteobacteria bacterium]|nr:hypothetical protein [Pseudomonadota bacterium]